MISPAVILPSPNLINPAMIGLTSPMQYYSPLSGTQPPRNTPYGGSNREHYKHSQRGNGGMRYSTGNMPPIHPKSANHSSNNNSNNNKNMRHSYQQGGITYKGRGHRKYESNNDKTQINKQNETAQQQQQQDFTPQSRFPSNSRFPTNPKSGFRPYTAPHRRHTHPLQSNQPTKTTQEEINEQQRFSFENRNLHRTKKLVGMTPQNKKVIAAAQYQVGSYFPSAQTVPNAAHPPVKS